MGPSWKDLAGEQVELADGTTVAADEAYLRKSILEPNFAILGVVALAAVLAFLVHAAPMLVGSALLIGCVAVLVVSTRKGMTRR